MVLRFYVQELPKAQLAVVLVLKSLRRRGNSLNSHSTDWEKPGIKRQKKKKNFLWLSLGRNQYRREGL